MAFNARAAGCKCDVCPRKGQTVVPPEGDKNAKVVWLGQDPGQQEERQLRPFVGPTGKRLAGVWALAERSLGVEYPRARVWVTNASLCRPKTNSAKEARLAVECCKPRLMRELRRAGPDAWVLAMGKWAFYALTGRKTGIGRYLGFDMHVRL